nr:hypothetical protein [Streptomyces sp. NRRL F-2747]
MTVDFAPFVADARADAAVVGLVLKGSQAHDGMTTRHSDHDLYVILADDTASELASLRCVDERFVGHIERP